MHHLPSGKHHSWVTARKGVIPRSPKTRKEEGFMVVRCSPSRTFLRRFAIAVSAIALASLPITARAQNDTHGYSSSSDYNKSFLNDEDIDGASLAADPNPSPSPKPQYGQTNSRYPTYESRWSKVAFEAGGGFTAPVGNDVSGGQGVGLSGYDTWGYNLTLGGGWNFNKWLGVLAEYQFNRNKIPGSTLAVLGAPGGNINTWSLTIDPIIYLPPITSTMGVYVTGGGGFYRKVTNFTSPACEEGFFGVFCQNETIYHLSSNQGGLNIGAGGYWKAFGPDSRAKLYAEARYVWVDSPSAAAENGYLAGGTEGLIPVTFGIRF
jgi:hypothetical protein